jgi:hypothetical protein
MRRSRGLGDVYKRQVLYFAKSAQHPVTLLLLEKN